MDQTLKITNVLADPTRYHIYQHIGSTRDETTVQSVSDSFSIHPNVARMHLSKLEEAGLIQSELKKTGKGGRPGRCYKLSDEVIQLSFPFRDYQLLASIALQSMMRLGEAGKDALYQTGLSFGKALIKNQEGAHSALTFQDKLDVLKNAAILAGLSPEFQVDLMNQTFEFHLYNCPFKELASEHPEGVCSMHTAYLLGMIEAMFPNARLEEKENKITGGCSACSYTASVTV